MKNTILMVISLILLASLIFVSCTPDDKNETDQNSDVSADESGENTLFNDLPTYDGKEKEIWFLVRGLEATERYQSVEIGADEINNELINDSVFERNKLVEAYLNVKIKAYATGNSESIEDMIRQQDMAEDDIYQVVMPTMNKAAVLAAEGIFYDLNSEEIAENLDLSKPWWDQRANEDLTIGGRLFFTTGDISILDNACTSAIIFNKKMVADNNLDNPYQLVKDGEWTLDKLLEMAKKVTEDSDGSGQMDYKDTWGFMSALSSINPMVIGSGERFITKDNDDMPVLAMGGNRFVNVLDKYAQIIGDRSATLPMSLITQEHISEAGFGDVYYLASDAFGSNRVLFRTISLVDLFDLNDYYVDYGILPIPKLSKEQDDYHTFISPVGVPGVCIPVTNKSPAETALVVAAMAEASTGTLNETYYEIMLKKRKVEDNDSREILDILFNTRVYDLGLVFDWSDMTWFLPYCVTDSGENLFASQFETRKEAIRAAIEVTVDSFK